MITYWKAFARSSAQEKDVGSPHLNRNNLFDLSAFLAEAPAYGFRFMLPRRPPGDLQILPRRLPRPFLGKFRLFRMAFQALADEWERKMRDNKKNNGEIKLVAEFLAPGKENDCLPPPPPHGFLIPFYVCINIKKVLTREGALGVPEKKFLLFNQISVPFLSLGLPPDFDAF